MILETWDATQFCVSKAVLTSASSDLWSRATEPDLPLEPRSGLPHLYLNEDSDAVLAVLQAIHPLPTIPITSATLGLKAITVASNLGLHPTLFRLDSSVQEEGAIIADPFGLCALAWSIGDQAVLDKASRFTHRIPVHTLLDRSCELPNGFEVLSAILSTRLTRRHAIDAVLSSLLVPGARLCEKCRAFSLIALVEFFNQPFPDTSYLIDRRERILWSSPITCQSGQECRDAMRNMSYSDDELAEVKASLARVPQVILPWAFEERFGRLMESARSTWTSCS